MPKLRYGILFLVLLLALVACSKKEDTPVDRLSAYVDLWNEAKFTEMYDDYITESSKEVFGKEQFIERTEKLYADLDISSVEVIFDKPEEEKTYKKEEDVEFPVQIKLETIAGEIEFKKNVPLTYNEQGETKNWFIEWDPSFILPDLSMHDKVGISTIQSKRGEIYDRHDKAIAINGSGAEIGIVPEKFNAEADAEKLATLLGTTADFINEQLNQSWVQPGHFVPIKKLPFTQEEIYNEALQIAGVTSMKAEMREYPYAKSLAHLIGYIGQINAEELEELKDKGYKESDLVGKRGLEQLLEERLRGEDGIQIYIEKTEQNGERVTVAETPAVDGENITLTIDAEFQKAVFVEMNGEPGTAAIIDPKTGETLVLASSPAFDPNELALGIHATRYAELTDDPAEPLLNRFAATYAPGSSIKPITAAIGLTAGTLKPEEGHTIEGKKWQKDSSWGNFHVTRLYTAPNPVDLKKALVYSDNIYFAKEALKMGNKQFIEGLQQFGFGEEIPFKYGLRTSQISNDGKIASEGQLADTSFGQGQMLMNILHLASTYGAIVNDGQMTKPVLFADEKKSEVWKEGLLSAEHAAMLQEDLRAVVTDGFAEAANIPSPKISGKTGTTELKSSQEEAGKENGFFVAYPTDDPTYIIAMMIEGVENKGGSGYVAEKVANVMKTR
ncbi:penicillin-binding transpeptidase domain-containing protein [Sporosarcina ureilytica]|uniref:Peptidoglycan glycosyltransferase n=1 Tax=Sporosarcina ureilytica TaxID=298596 RepID=A0A1D8JEH7_9BACL|nr:penicillin-binding transpeptidase domain-containing protein [Sporosarcina ureilytica]AOV07117.1 peptidoglycan glycosyltransferase [Sporosarcina ureilytica]